MALASAPPMYTDAANRSLLQHELQTVPNRSAFSFFYHYVKGSSVEGADWDAYAALDQYMETRYSQDLGLPHRSDMHYVKSDLFQVFPLRDGQYEVRDRPLLRGYLGFIDRLEEYVSVAEGEFPAQGDVEGSSDEVVDVLVSEEFAVEAGLQVGEGYTLFDPSARTSTGNVVRLEIPIRIAGIWIPRTEGGATWHLPALSFANVFLVPENTYISEIGARVPHALTDVGWYKVVDGDSVRAEDVDRFLGRVNRVDRQIKSRIATTYLELSPVSALRRYRLVASTQAILLLLFSIPILGLVLYFIVLIADSTVKRQQIEISILKSRGATTGQVFSIYLLQGATLGIFALAVGPELGKVVAQFIGGTRYFMTFEAQTPLQIETTTTSMTYTVVAIGGALLATVLPAMGAARLAIVEAKQEVSRRQRRSFWERSYVDFLLLGVASYGYYMLRTQGRIAFLQADVPADPLDNPLLFLAPALFILAVALVAVRLFPIIALVLSMLWARLGGISMLLAFYNLARTGRVYTSLLLLLILTTSLGTFTASMARTLDANLVARIFYEVGADVTLTEGAALRILPSEDGRTGRRGGGGVCVDQHAGGRTPAGTGGHGCDPYRRFPGFHTRGRQAGQRQALRYRPQPFPGGRVFPAGLCQ